MRQLILASSSPRRFELMKKLGVPFTVEASDVNEDLTADLSPKQLACELSKKKAQAIARKHTDAIVIGADTIVVIDHKVLGKPKSLDKAREMLNLLNGKTHEVITGFTIIDTSKNRIITQSETTKVTFRQLTDAEIESYLHEINVFDKAGAYAIQEGTTKVVDHFDGDYDNIVGLPVKGLIMALKKFRFSSTSFVIDK